MEHPVIIYLIWLVSMLTGLSSFLLSLFLKSKGFLVAVISWLFASFSIDFSSTFVEAFSDSFLEVVDFSEGGAGMGLVIGEVAESSAGTS